MGNIWFTSDTHFNHQRILQDRPEFNSLEEMNETLIINWNERVKPGDRVYHLGDFALGNASDLLPILERLHGQIYLVRGNHEKVAEHKLIVDRFVWVKDYLGLKIGDQKIYLCHYAFRTWNCMHHGSWHLHGHSHGSLEDLPNSKSFDVNTFEELLGKGEVFYWGHHPSGNTNITDYNPTGLIAWAGETAWRITPSPDSIEIERLGTDE